MARLDYPDSKGKKERTEEVQRKLREVQATLSAPAGSAETRADAILEVLNDLREMEQQRPDSRAVRELLRQAGQEATVLRDHLWQDGQQRMSGRAVGQTLGRRCKRAEESVRLLAKAKELDLEELSALTDDLSRARYRLSYLQNAQRKAQAAWRHRLPIYGLLGVVAVAAFLLLCLALDLVPLPAWLARGAPTTTPAPGRTVIPTAGDTASLSAAQTAAPTPGSTASPAMAEAAWSPTTTPGSTASPTPLPVTRSPTAPPGSTASPTPLPVTRSPTATPGYTVPAAPSLTPRPTATPTPSAIPTPRPTTAPTARPRRATPTHSPTAGASPAANLAPRPVYPAPQLLQPGDAVFFSPGAGYQYPMRWQWDGTLRADEWFDVRVWQEGMPHYGIAWTKQPEYTFDLCLKGSGYFFWSVAVIRGQEGRWLADLSPEATQRRFSTSKNDRWCVRNGRSFPSSVP